MAKDYPNERDCEHGQLRRACPICDAERSLAELQEAVRWERECFDTWALILRDNTEVRAIREICDSIFAARAAVDALVGGGMG